MTAQQTSWQRKLHRTLTSAKAAGARTYFTGEPCVRGHISTRYTANGTCLECSRNRSTQKDKMAAWRVATDKLREHRALSAEACAHLKL